jgi:hypothetical protein
MGNLRWENNFDSNGEFTTDNQYFPNANECLYKQQYNTYGQRGKYLYMVAGHWP